MFIEGPEVFLKWSPAVSPTTVAVCVGFLAAVMALLGVLLGAVPGAVCVRHHEREKHAAEQRTGQHTAEGFGADEEAHHGRRCDRDDARQRHLLERRGGGDVDAARGIRFKLVKTPL